MAFSQPASISKKATANTYALVVGIGQYEHRSIPALRFAEQDARIFGEYLMSPAGGNIPEKQVRSLIGEHATISNIYEGLKWLKGICRKKDKVILYFSGHGDVETDHVKNLGYLLAWNTPPNNYRNNAIRLEDVNDWANEISLKKGGEILLITDACHSGKLAGDFLKGNQLTREKLRTVLNNEVRITACGPDELAAEGTEWGGGRGVFSWYLLNGLNGLASSQQPGAITLGELQLFLDSSFANDKFLKEQDHRQKPISDGHPGFVMANTDPQVLSAYRKSFQQQRAAIPRLPAGLLPFKA
ncbi:MAG TPA: caspase family protein, partial [Phnomibacter sp.]|nr:caspase family protein [Phnomibacter sp.]